MSKTSKLQRSIIGLAFVTAVTGGAALQASMASASEAPNAVAAPTAPHEFPGTGFGLREPQAYSNAMANAQFKAKGSGYKVGNCSEDKDPVFSDLGGSIEAQVSILCQPLT